jgi:hypothetical protein
VLAVEREAGFAHVVEGLRVDRPDVGSRAGVLDVAGDAVLPGVAVNPLLRGDPLGDRLVAVETLHGGDLLARLVALLAVVEAFPLGVRLRERPGGNERSESLCRAGLRDGEQREEREGRRERESPRGSASRRIAHAGPLSQKCTE